MHVRLFGHGYRREKHISKSSCKNDVIKINYITTKMINSREISKCKLCWDEDVKIDHMSEKSKLIQKRYKNW